MKLYYRISDNSYEKTKLAGATKEKCLQNFLQSFGSVLDGNLYVIADNCGAETIQMLSDKNLNIIQTSLGNAGSLKRSIEMALSDCQPDELVYFCEDDYLHKNISPVLLEEGIKRADYVTLYDHPDKYMPEYNFGEFSKVIKTRSSHWRYTISTCMTFGTKAGTLKEDLDIWLKHISGNHPHDHLVFSELGKVKRRRLAVCIPGSACHTDLEYSTRTNKMLIEPWAIEELSNIQ